VYNCLLYWARSLKNLDLGGNDAGPDGALALAEALALHPSLTMLELGYNPLGPKGAATIAGRWLSQNDWGSSSSSSSSTISSSSSSRASTHWDQGGQQA
jgi:hypothetical protein